MSDSTFSSLAQAPLWTPPSIIVPGSEIMKHLPPTLSDARERMVLDYVQSGNVPSWLQCWVPVPVKAGELTGTIYVMPDYFSIGTDDDFVRVHTNPVTGEYIAKQVNGMLPTRKMVKDIYAASSCHIPAMPMNADQGYPIDTMLETKRWPIMDDRIDGSFTYGPLKWRNDFTRGALWEGHLKNMVIGPGLADAKGMKVGIFGWWDASGNIIQGPSINWHSHEWTYCDYSHGLRVVYAYMMVGEEMRPVSEVLADPALCALISDEGIITKISYLDYHPNYLVAA